MHSTSDSRTEGPVRAILAAGGIVWGPEPGGSRVALIHRPRHGGDWSLPKGKLQQGESLEQGALREVEEEIGCKANLGPIVGLTYYPINEDSNKLVVFWSMEPVHVASFVPSEEVDRLEWLSPSEAIKRLSYAQEKELVAKAAEEGDGGRRHWR